MVPLAILCPNSYLHQYFKKKFLYFLGTKPLKVFDQIILKEDKNLII